MMRHRGLHPTSNVSFSNGYDNVMIHTLLLVSISLDMNSLACSSTADGQYIINNFIAPFRSHPNQYHYNSKMLLSTFAGQWCTFGQASAPAGWQWLISQAGTPIYFIPNLQIGDATTLSTTWNFIDGFSESFYYSWLTGSLMETKNCGTRGQRLRRITPSGRFFHEAEISFGDHSIYLQGR